jgi:hypothetical protein
MTLSEGDYLQIICCMTRLYYWLCADSQYVTFLQEFKQWVFISKEEYARSFRFDENVNCLIRTMRREIQIHNSQVDKQIYACMFLFRVQ